MTKLKPKTTKEKVKKNKTPNIGHVCLHCRKPYGDHKADTHVCPDLRFKKHRTFGYSNFTDAVFSPDPDWKYEGFTI